MQGQSQIQGPHIRFNRWSRAGWAIFRSLGRIVNIGHVDMHIQEKAMLKVSGLKSFIQNMLSSGDDAESDTEKDSLDSTALSALLSLLFALVLTTQLDFSSSGLGRINFQNIFLTTITTGGILLLFGMPPLYFIAKTSLNRLPELVQELMYGVFPKESILAKQHVYDTGN